MSCDPVLAAMLARPWNNNACRGYVIYAMENCGFSPTDIRRVVAELHEVFDRLDRTPKGVRFLCPTKVFYFPTGCAIVK